MNLQQQLSAKLEAALRPAYLSVVDESHQHNVPPGAESHFALVVVSDAFVGQSPVRRHQSLYQLFAAELAGPIHALSLSTYTLAEWAARGEIAATSPPCLGGEAKSHPTNG